MASPPRVGHFPPAQPSSTRVPMNGTMDEKLASLARAIDRKAELNAVPSFAAVVLSDENGAQYRVIVDATSGTLRVDPIAVRP